jgi:hypothetical protein
VSSSNWKGKQHKGSKVLCRISDTSTVVLLGPIVVSWGAFPSLTHGRYEWTSSSYTVSLRFWSNQEINSNSILKKITVSLAYTSRSSGVLYWQKKYFISLSCSWSGQMEAFFPSIWSYYTAQETHYVSSTQKISWLKQICCNSSICSYQQHFKVGLLLFDHARGDGCRSTVRRRSLQSTSCSAHPSSINRSRKRVLPPIRLLSHSFFPLAAQPLAVIMQARSRTACWGHRSIESVE